MEAITAETLQGILTPFAQLTEEGILVSHPFFFDAAAPSRKEHFATSKT